MHSHTWTLERLARYFVALLLLLAPGAGTAAAQGGPAIVTGVTGDGSSYGLAMPVTWNGDLVVYAHGIVDPGAPVVLPSPQDGFAVLRDLWVQKGYAVAYSSFSENGYSLKSAITRTHQLRGLFAAQFGQPGRTFLTGHSLGGLAVLALAEKYPEQYDGALPMCAPLGGGSAEIQYLGDARVLFDYFFPGVIPGGPFSVTEGTAFTPGSPVFNGALAALSAGLAAPGQPTLQFARAARLPFTSIPQIVASGMSVAGFSVRFSTDVVEHAHGHIPYDNTSTIFSGSANDAALNAGVERFAAAPDAANYFAKYFTPTGDLSVPTLTLHTRFDPVAPFEQERGYAKAVADAGSTPWLTQRAISSYGHCNINAAETMSGFDALIAWVNGGAKPADGDATIR
jgi:pimeloyl-ACP methyl ester carboxylesterase